MGGVGENPRNSPRNFQAMTEIKQAAKSGIPLIRKLALEAFPATYAKILTPEQTE